MLLVTVSSAPHFNCVSTNFPPANPLSLRVQCWPWHSPSWCPAQSVWPGSFPGKWEAGREATAASPHLQPGAKGWVREAVTVVR